MSQHTPGLSREGLSRLSGLLSGLDRLAGILEITADPDPNSSEIVFDRFRLTRRLGAGRFGIVLLADDQKLHRQVVLKVPQPAVLTDPGARERFVREARSAARLDHPGIVPIYDAGETEGLPYLVAGYVAGPTLAEWRRLQPGFILPATAARMTMKLALALQHAHERGVLHCDLSPANILLDSSNATTHDVPEPVITDFGLARLLEDDPALTRTYQIAGTPHYMAPEQARGDRRNLTARADVHALGMILYELLVGVTPFAGETAARVMYDVIHTAPRPLRKVNAAISRDLEALCLKCLEKDPSNRYPSAGALAEDLGRFLKGQTTAARPVSPATQVWRAVRQRPLISGLVAVAFLAVCAVPAIAIWYSFRLEEAGIARQQAEHDADRDRELADTRESFAALERVRVRRLEQQPGWVDKNLADLHALAKLSPAVLNLADLRSEAVAALTAVDLKPIRTLAEGFSAYFPAYSPDGKTLALGAWEERPDGLGVVRFYDPSNGQLKKEWTFPFDPEWSRLRDGKPDGCRTVAFSPDGRWLVAGTRGGQLARWDLTDPDPKPIVWNAHTGDHFGNHEKLKQVFVRAIMFSADSKTMYSSSKERTQKWDVGTDWRAVGPLEPFLIPIGTPVLNGNLTASLLSEDPSEQTVRIDNTSGTAVRYSVRTGACFTTSSDGQLTVFQTGQSDLSLLGDDLTTPPAPFQTYGRFDQFDHDHLGFAPGNGLLASSEEPRKRIQLWDGASGELVADRAVSGGSARFAFSPDSRHLAVTELNKTVVYEITGTTRETLAVSSRRTVKTFAASPDGKELVTIAQGGSLFIVQTTWGVTKDEIPVPRTVRFHDHFISGTPSADYHPNLDQFVFATSEKTAYFKDANGDRIEFNTNSFIKCDSISDLRFDVAGRLWIVEPNGLFLNKPWNQPKESKEVILDNDTEAKSAGMVFRAVAPGRQNALLGRRDGCVFIINDLKSPAAPVRVFDSGVTAVALAADEAHALIGGERGELVELTLSNGSVRVIPHAHSDEVRTVAYGPGGWYATGSADRTIKLWDPSGRLLLTLRNGSGIRKLAISADGQLLTGLLDNERAVRRWRLDLLGMNLTALGIPMGLPAGANTPR